MVILLPSKRVLRNEIHWKGPKNGLNKADDRVAQSVFGVPKSHISFVKQTHRTIASYNEAQEDLCAASVTLTAFHNYYVETQDDPLFKEFYECYREVVATGAEEAIARCKEIHQFVRYPEYEYPYERYSYEWLTASAKYKRTDQYPYNYFMLYDIINEFDLKLSDNEKQIALIKYAQDYLGESQYAVGQPELVDRLNRSMNCVAKAIPQRIKKRIKRIICEPESNQKRLGRISNAACGVGNKREDFFSTLAVRGISPDLVDQVELDFSRLEYLYGTHHTRPQVKPGGLTRAEYLPNVIAREDPKKPRIAYQDGPLMDYIGYPGMDVLVQIFEPLPFAQCGRKREDIEDILLDKHRYDAIQLVLNHNNSKGRNTVSTDLTKATEHLNMITTIDVVATFLEILLPDVDSYQIRTWCEMTYGQLYKTPVILQGITELQNDLFYTKAGQLQGTPGSFHCMTFILMLINIQACLESGIAFEDAKWSVQNNGDDGTLPEQALTKFQEILEIITGPGVFNQEKSFSSSINGSLEFCKTIVYSNNANLITGYRYSTLYKLCKDPNGLLYLQSPKFAHERSVCYRFLQYMEQQQDWIDPDERIDFTISLLMFEDIEILKRTVTVQQLQQQFAINELLLQASVNRIGKYDLMVVPEDWRILCHQNKTYTVLGEGNIMVADLKVLNQYHSELEKKFPIPRRLLYTANQQEFQGILDNLRLEYNLEPKESFLIREDSEGVLFTETGIVMPAPASLVSLSEGQIQNIVLAPKVATQIGPVMGDWKLSVEATTEVLELWKEIHTSGTGIQLVPNPNAVDITECGAPPLRSTQTTAEKAAAWVEEQNSSHQKCLRLGRMNLDGIKPPDRRDS